MTNAGCIFVVDEDLSARKGLARLIRTAGYDVRDLASVDVFLGTLSTDEPGCVILDAGSPGLSFKELQSELKALGISPPIIVVTANDDAETRRKARELNATSFFRKPVDGPALLDAVEWAMRS